MKRIKKFGYFFGVLYEKLKPFPKTLLSLLQDKFGKDPFIILVSCMLSARSRDTVTYNVCIDLFNTYKTPKDILNEDIDAIENKLRRIGCFRRKAAHLKMLCKEIIERHKSSVPNDFDDLCSLSGVGRKTASLVISAAFNIPSIAVDTHVFRIARKIGLSNKETALGVEKDLKKAIPKKFWSNVNDVFVRYGQNFCKYKDINCSNCRDPNFCKWMLSFFLRSMPYIGVTK